MVIFNKLGSLCKISEETQNRSKAIMIYLKLMQINDFYIQNVERH